MKGQLLKRQSLTFCGKGAFVNHSDRRTRGAPGQSQRTLQHAVSGPDVHISVQGLLHTYWDNVRDLSLQLEDVCIVRKNPYKVCFTVLKKKKKTAVNFRGLLWWKHIWPQLATPHVALLDLRGDGASPTSVLHKCRCSSFESPSLSVLMDPLSTLWPCRVNQF